MKALYAFALVFLLVSGIAARAQGPGCAPYYTSPTYLSPHLSEPPLLGSQAPADAQLGYYAARLAYYSTDVDSLYRVAAQATTFNDTVRKMMRYFFAMVDYDPFLFMQLLSLPPASDTNIDLRRTYSAIVETIRRVSPTSALDYPLMRASLVARVRCDFTKLDTMAEGGSDALVVTTASCTILDTIKGKRLPSCWQDVKIRRSPDGPGEIQFTAYATTDPDTVITEAAVIGQCLRFHYASRWGVRELTQKWIRPREEYIVFLDVLPVCRDAYGTYVSIRPAGPPTPTFRMFPIQSDTVLMPGDELGLGAESMPVAAFIDALRARIVAVSQY